MSKYNFSSMIHLHSLVVLAMRICKRSYKFLLSDDVLDSYYLLSSLIYWYCQEKFNADILIRALRWFLVCTSSLCIFVNLFTLFCFDSCKTAQNVTFHIYLHEIDSRFLFNCHHGCRALCFILSDTTWQNNFMAVKNQRKCLKDEACGSQHQ